MTIRNVEVRSARSWDDAAIAIIEKLKTAGVKKRQLLWIDAHNNEPDGDAIMSAFWDDKIAGDGPLEIAFHAQNAKYSWDEFYKQAANKVSTLHPESVISMTGSCNAGGSAIFYVFYYSDTPLVNAQHIRYCEARASSTWEAAAQGIASKLMNEGAKVGQIICVDAHNNDNDGDAIFSAFWNASLPAYGDLQIKHKTKNDKQSWDHHYQWASNTIASESGNLDVHSITSSCNSGGYGVTYIFHASDDVLSLEYQLDQGKISESASKVIATQYNRNDTSVDQKITFAYTESNGTSTDNTSSFSHETGTSITVGTEFKAGVPFISEGKISTEITQSYSHTWGQETTISNDFSSSTEATVEVVAKPQMEVKCEFTIQEAKMDVPYVMTLKSGKRSTGIWKGVSCWDFRAEFTETPI